MNLHSTYPDIFLNPENGGKDFSVFLKDGISVCKYLRISSSEKEVFSQDVTNLHDYSLGEYFGLKPVVFEQFANNLLLRVKKEILKIRQKTHGFDGLRLNSHSLILNIHGSKLNAHGSHLNVHGSRLADPEDILRRMLHTSQRKKSRSRKWLFSTEAMPYTLRIEPYTLRI